MTATVSDTREIEGFSKIRSPKIKAIALLAHTFNWQAGVRPAGGLMLDHPFTEGIVLPTDGSNLRDAVFKSKVRHVCQYPPSEDWKDRNDGRLLAEAIADTVGLKKSDRTTFVKAVVEKLGGSEKKKEEEVKKMPAPELAPEQGNGRPTLTYEKPVRAIVSTRPARRVKYTKPKEGVVEYEESLSAIERTWSDGTVDFECKYPGCDYTRDKLQSVAVHFARMHGKESKPAEPEIEAEPEVGPAADAIVDANDPGIPAPRFPDAVSKLNEIAKIIGLGDENEKLRERNAELEAEINDLRGSLNALRELLAGIGGGNG